MTRLFLSQLFLLGVLAVTCLCAPEPQFQELTSEKEALAWVNAFEKDGSTKMDPTYISVSMNRGWWTAAERIVIYYLDTGVDVTSHVYRASNVIKSSIKRITDTLTNRGRPWPEVSPAFQWAQNTEEIRLNVKYASRWDTPSTLGCQHVALDCTSSSLYYSVKCPSTSKMFVLNLTLRMDILPESCTYSAASVGRATININKKGVALWPYLLSTKKKPGNMHTWYAMEEQLKSEPLKRSGPAAQESAPENHTETAAPSNETVPDSTDARGDADQATPAEVTADGPPSTAAADVATPTAAAPPDSTEEPEFEV